MYKRKILLCTLLPFLQATTSTPEEDKQWLKEVVADFFTKIQKEGLTEQAIITRVRKEHITLDFLKETVAPLKIASTLLHRAVQYGFKELTRVLLEEKKMPIDLPDKNCNITPLWLTVSFNKLGGILHPK